MPRPNQPRSIASESALARRIAFEREDKGMSYEGLASRMSKAGCSINASAIYKIEKADPPRRITVDELVGFSQVFGIPVEELLLPPEIVARKELLELVLAWDRARLAALDAASERDRAWDALRAYLSAHPELTPEVESAMRAWAEYYSPEDVDEVAAYWTGKITGSREHLEEAARLFHKHMEEDA